MLTEHLLQYKLLYESVPVILTEFPLKLITISQLPENYSTTILISKVFSPVFIHPTVYMCNEH